MKGLSIVCAMLGLAVSIAQAHFALAAGASAPKFKVLALAELKRPGIGSVVTSCFSKLAREAWVWSTWRSRISRCGVRWPSRSSSWAWTPSWHDANVLGWELPGGRLVASNSFKGLPGLKTDPAYFLATRDAGTVVLDDSQGIAARGKCVAAANCFLYKFEMNGFVASS